MKQYLNALSSTCLLAMLSACATANPVVENEDGAHRQTLSGHWHITQIEGQATKTPDYRLSFDPQQQRFSAYFGCNRIMGSYRQQGNRLSFNDIASTRMACRGDNLENTALAALAQITHWQIDAVKSPASHLSLYDQQGRIRLSAQALPASAQ